MYKTIPLLSWHINKKKILIILISLTIVCILSLSMYLWAINQTNAEHWKNNIFIRINIILNTGISYSLFADNPIVVYSLQWISILLIFFWLLILKNLYLVGCSSIAFGGGLFNALDRAITCKIALNGGTIKENSVIDYFIFTFYPANQGIWNIPDALICSSIIGVIIFAIYFFFFKKNIKEKKNFNVIYKDQWIIVVNKFKNLLVHPTTFNETNTLINKLAKWIKIDDFPDKQRFGVVHRLDKNTTGLIIIARNKLAYEALTEQISKNAIKRKYLAIVHKQFTENHLLLKLPISRIKNKSQFVVSRNKTAKDSITEIHVIKNLHNAALIECELKTGRTHQIRVHLAYIKHPIFNDSIYGKNDGYKDYEQFLCANYISFFHPKTLKKMEFTIKPDRIFNELLQKLQ